MNIEAAVANVAGRAAESSYTLEEMVRQTAAGKRAPGQLLRRQSCDSLEGSLELERKRVLYAHQLQQGLRSPGPLVTAPVGELPPLSSYPPPPDKEAESIYESMVGFMTRTTAPASSTIPLAFCSPSHLRPRSTVVFGESSGRGPAMTADGAAFLAVRALWSKLCKPAFLHVRCQWTENQNTDCIPNLFLPDCSEGSDSGTGAGTGAKEDCGAPGPSLPVTRK